jgi:hypothetical protein
VILVDTSVWIDYFNGIGNPQTELLDDAIGEGSVVMGDLIFLEILQGIRDDEQCRRTQKSLLVLEHVELFGADRVIKCAENYRALRKRGVTIRKTADLIIASFCIDKALPLLFLDRDFIPFVEHLALKPALRSW